MRPARLFAIAVAGVLTIFACPGAPSAPADTFCKLSGLHSGECPIASRYTGNLTGLTGAGNPAVLLENGNVKGECHSKILALGSSITDEGAHVGIQILVDKGALTFTNCNGICEKGESTRPVLLLLQALTLDAFVTEDGSGKPRIKLSKCMFEIECEYQFTNGSQLLAIGTDTILASSVPLEKVGGSLLCPSNMSLDATWLTTEDQTGGVPIYVSALP